MVAKENQSIWPAHGKIPCGIAGLSGCTREIDSDLNIISRGAPEFAA
jgi:hypothetical protein